MADYKWPDQQHRSYLGKKIDRLDGPVKLTGRAKYTYDYNPKGLLYGVLVTCPYARAKVLSVDTSAAEKMPGVKALKVVKTPGTETHWAGDEIVALAAVDERIAEDAVRAVVVKYEVLPHFVQDEIEPPKDIPLATGPLSQEDMEDMFSNQVPEGKIVDAIKTRGINWKPNEGFFKDLKGYGVPEPVIEALRGAQVKPGPAGPKSPYKRTAVQTEGDPDKAFTEAAYVVEGIYGMPVITHCCMETHGLVAEWPDQKSMKVHVSTQNVSGMAAQMAPMLNLSASDIHVEQQNIGGGFGSKFGPDSWGMHAAELSKMAGGAPVKMMLDRKVEQEMAGARPSAYGRVKVGADKDGNLIAWESNSWGTGGVTGGGSPPLPYLFRIPNQKRQHTAVSCNIGSARAWRAPNHPQASLLTECALDDLAAKMGMDPMDFFLKNIEMTGPRAKTYIEEFKIAAEMIGWKEKWHSRGDKTPGPLKRGLGLGLHTWGGRGHESHCDLTVHPDGGVEVRIGSQDLGTGTRTVIAIVIADAMGIPIEHVKVFLGDNKYPMSGASGGSTTSGGVSSSTHRAAVDARDALLAKIAPSLKAQPEELEVVKGTVRVKSDHSRAMTWKQACAKVGPVGITVRGNNPDRTKPPDLTNSGIGGVQMAEVSVDIETGVVRVERLMAVQDAGLIVSKKTCETQMLGGMIMAVSYSLYEEKVMDPTTGRMLNPNIEFYRLAGLPDIKDLRIHLYNTQEQENRGVIGIAEGAVTAPGTAISNAIANAIGVRVPFMPFTPDRVLAALEEHGQNAMAGGAM